MDANMLQCALVAHVVVAGVETQKAERNSETDGTSVVGFVAASLRIKDACRVKLSVRNGLLFERRMQLPLQLGSGRAASLEHRPFWMPLL
jgi:hypothetical protein